MPSRPTARAMAIVSAPEPLPASSTRAPGNRSPYTITAPRSFGYTMVAMRGISRVKSAIVGFTASSQWPLDVSTRAPSGWPIRTSWRKWPKCEF